MSTVKNTKRNINYIDEQPPEKKLISDGDILIKELYEKQTTLTLDLKEQLQNSKEFEKSTEFLPLTNYFAGSSSLQNFEEIVQRSSEIETMKAAGLTSDDINLVLDSRRGDDFFYHKHRNYERTLLQIRLDAINRKIEEYDRKITCDAERKKATVSRHKTEFALAVKPNSHETKLLKFALSNERQNCDDMPHPMDNIKQIEEERFGNTTTEKIPLNKIRKKARNLTNKIAKIRNTVEENTEKIQVGRIKYSANSKWDVKESIPEEPKPNVAKHYSCKPERLYTIKDGEIVQITRSNPTSHLLERVNLEEIKSNPKFANYTEGEPSNALYLKNLHKKVTEEQLKDLVGQHTKENCEIKILKGKMSGQAFITFQSVKSAEHVLHQINGVILRSKPIIAAYKRTAS